MKPSSPWQKSISSPKTQAEACTTKSSFLCALRRFFEHCGTDILVCVGVRIRTHRHECLCHNCSRISINHYPRLCGAEPRCGADFQSAAGFLAGVTPRRNAAAARIGRPTMDSSTRPRVSVLNSHSMYGLLSQSENLMALAS